MRVARRPPLLLLCLAAACVADGVGANEVPDESAAEDSDQFVKPRDHRLLKLGLTGYSILTWNPSPNLTEKASEREDEATKGDEWEGPVSITVPPPGWLIKVGGGPLESAGFMTGDLLIQVGDKPFVETSADLERVILESLEKRKFARLVIRHYTDPDWRTKGGAWTEREVLVVPWS